MFRVLWFLTAVAVLVNGQTNCPDQDPELVLWNPPSDESLDFVISGQKLLLTSPLLRLHSITIRDGGVLVVSDHHGDIRLELKYMLIRSDGEFHVGSDTCLFQSNFEFMLYGRSDDPDMPNDPVFGQKYIGIGPTGTISIHGASKLSWTHLTTTILADQNNIRLDLADAATNWVEGDQIVIASSDYDMNHAEVFTIANCNECSMTQVEVEERAQFMHLGTISAQGVDMRAEVGMLTRNVKIFGEVQNECYDPHSCQFFDYDTFGGHVFVAPDFKRADFVGIELYNMGQQVLGRYPIHYHIVGKVYGSIVKNLAIHNCFSRCVTLHGSEGLLVQDVVGYNTLGHCFFLEDGNEQNNQLIHNLGLVTKPGTLLPSDRDQAMCEGILDSVHPGYVPDADSECMEASTFWIAHPNNTIRFNSAAGSVNNGYHFVFHREPTGPSSGTLPAYHGERSNIQMFTGNKAHSNADYGLLLDRGVKTDHANEDDPREFLAVGDEARFMPHVDGDLLQPRLLAHITELTSYMNHVGARVRGGDIRIEDSKFSDNDIGVIMQSDDIFPGDAGSHQELVYSTVVATTDFNDPEWQARTHPSVGVQFMSGPVLLDNDDFYSYTSAGGREAYALGFYPQYNGQLCPDNTVGGVTFTNTPLKAYFGRADSSSIHGSYDFDGDLNQVFYDRDGALTGWPNSHAVRRDNSLLVGYNCVDVVEAGSTVCMGDSYGQIFVTAETKTANMTIERPVAPLDPVTLRGINKDDTETNPNMTIYEATVIVDRDYHIHFTEPTSDFLELVACNFPQNGYAKVSIPYEHIADASELQIDYVLWKQMEDEIVSTTPLTAGASIDDVDNDPEGLTFFWDTSNSYLYLKLLNRYAVDGYNYCAAEGCQLIHIKRL